MTVILILQLNDCVNTIVGYISNLGVVVFCLVTCKYIINALIIDLFWQTGSLLDENLGGHLDIDFRGVTAFVPQLIVNRGKSSEI
jgi:hypothetical protein